MCLNPLRTLFLALLVTAAACTGHLELTDAPDAEPGALDVPAMSGQAGALADDDAGESPADSADGARSCIDDPLEDNDGPLAAVAIPGAGSLPALVACEGDQDWFELPLLDGDLVSIEVLFDNDDGNIDVQLLDAIGNVLSDSSSTTDDELVSFTAVGNTTVRLMVELTSDLEPDGNTYDLAVGIVNATTCRDDSREDDDTQGDATGLVDDYYTSGVSCDADEDWFAVDLAADDELTLDVLFAHAEGDINVTLLDAAGGTLDTGGSVSDHERVYQDAGAAETVYLVVSLAADAGVWAGNTYDLNVQILNRVVCAEDAAEDDDSPGDATVINVPGLYPHFVTCAADQDWFRFDLLAGQMLEASALFSPDEGDVSLVLEDDLGNVLTTGASVFEGVGVTWTAMADESLYLRVELAADGGWLAGTPYHLLVVIADPSVCIDDFLEDNDTPATATENPDRTRGEIACPADPDWFPVQLQADDVLTATVNFAHVEGNIDVELQDAAGGVLATASSTTDDEVLTYTSPVEQVVYFGVELTSDSGTFAGNSYMLEYIVENLTTCIDDPWEDNDTPTTSMLVPGSVWLGGLVSCPADSDWFELDLAADDVVEVSVLFEHALGDIDIELVDMLGNTLVASSTTDDEELVTYTALSPQTVRVLVTLVGESDPVPGNLYELLVWYGDSLSCPEDGYEDDDSALDATALTAPAAVTGLVACPGDPDWFEVSLGAGELAMFSVGFAHAEGDIDIQLLDMLGNTLDSSSTAADNESVLYTALSPQTVRLVVDLVSDAGALAGNAYDLGFEALPADSCSDDALEEDDSQADATPIVHGDSFTGLVSCPSDPDWFEIDVLAGETLLVHTFFSQADGDIDLELEDAAGSPLASGVQTVDAEEVMWTAPADTQVFVEVALAADGGLNPGNEYELWVAISSDGFECVDDAIELALAPHLQVGSGYLTDLVQCSEDQDWFEVDLNPDDTVVFDVFFTHATGDLDAWLEDETGGLLATSATTTDNEQITWTATAEEKVFLVIELTENLDPQQGNDYELGVTITNPVSCVGDALEVNNTDAEAAPLDGGLTSWLTICSGDYDWYAITLAAGETLTVDALFAHAEGNIDIELFDAALVSLTSSVSLDDDEQVTYTSPAGEVVLLIIDLVEDLGTVPGNSYELDLTIL